MLKNILQTIIFTIFCDSLIFYQSLLLPEVKRCAIISYKQGIHELPNDLKRRRILGNIRKVYQLHRMIA